MQQKQYFKELEKEQTKPKIDRPSATWTKALTQILKIWNKRDIKTNAIEIKRIVRDYYKQLHTNELDNLEDKYLETYNLSRQNHENKKAEQTYNC